LLHSSKSICGVSCLRNPMAARLERVLTGWSAFAITLDYYRA
jgi:hypothetical protein